MYVYFYKCVFLCVCVCVCLYVCVTWGAIYTYRDEVVSALNLAIDSREEGVVLKDPDSVYQPASRKAGWIKVKPEVRRDTYVYLYTLKLTFIHSN